MLLRPMAEAKVSAMGQGKVAAKVPAMAVDTVAAMVEATAAQSKRK